MILYNFDVALEVFETTMGVVIKGGGLVTSVRKMQNVTGIYLVACEWGNFYLSSKPFGEDQKELLHRAKTGTKDISKWWKLMLEQESSQETRALKLERKA